MGVILTPAGTAARSGVEGGAASITDYDPYFKALHAAMDDKGCLVTRSEALVYGILLLQRKIRRTGTIER